MTAPPAPREPLGFEVYITEFLPPDPCWNFQLGVRDGPFYTITPIGCVPWDESRRWASDR